MWILMELNHLLRIFSPAHRPPLPRIQTLNVILTHSFAKDFFFPVLSSGTIFIL